MITTARSISTSDSNNYPPSRYEDLKSEQIRSSTAFIQPRQPPMPSQAFGGPQGVPTISNATVGGQGVGGMAVTGQLFPPMRAATDPTRPARTQIPQDDSEKSLFNSFERTKAPARAVTVGKLAISNPVLQQGGNNPLDKVATTDLATAVQMDKDKRALMALQNAEVPEGRVDTTVSPEQGLRRSTTTIRKEIDAPVPVPEPASEATATGFATGAQLSPSGDELRRRSPRQAPTDNSDKESTKSSAMSSQTSRAPSPPAKSAARTLPGQENYKLVNPVIKPSRQAPPSPGPQVEAPPKTPLQRRPTNGLPGNPRALSVKRAAAPAEPKARQETVMFVNNIVYDDPSFVANVMEEARERGPKAPVPGPINTTIITAQDGTSLALQGPPTASSVVHRPRPIPRKNLKDVEGSSYYPTTHQRSKSAGLINQRKSILQSNPGSPTTLPPLPPPPQPPVNQARPLPNNTKSMTFNEKVEYLFPPPQGASRPQRRSSVPSMPGNFLSDSPTLTEFDGQNAESRDSEKSIDSTRTRSIFGEQDREQQREVSMAAYQDILNESEEQRQSQSPFVPGTIRSFRSNNGAKRASSPLLPVFGDLKSASTTYDDDMTNMGSLYSPQPAQKIGLAVHQARAIEVVRPGGTPNDRAISAVTNSEEMTIMLDTSVAREVRQDQNANGLDSPIDDGSPVEGTTSTRSSGPWHRRVGEETLSFSNLSDKRGSKRGPPPTPLSLSSRPTQAKQTALVQAAEPSPLPSPEEALKLIQEQLKKYEQADRVSTESPGRLALLNDLEMEMGQQETRWLGMQNEFSRDSLSTFATLSPMVESRRASAVADVSRNSSLRSNISEDRRASRRARMASMASSRQSAMEGDDLPHGARVGLWQKKLADAQLEFMEHELDRKRSMNFLSLSASNLGSPTPPDSEDSEDEIESRRNLAALLEARAKEEANAVKKVRGLWVRPERPYRVNVVDPDPFQPGMMWVRPEKPYHVPMAEPPLPGLDVRPTQRKDGTELSIDMDQMLWHKPAANFTSSSGLWQSSTVHESESEAEPEPTPVMDAEAEPRISKFYNPGLQRSRTVAARPLTQRPPRRSKRITALPDILEDPQPLPDKRDTLGIFQFPWGEKSDVASVPIRPSFIPGTMSSGSIRQTLEARSRQLEESEYSSSFFDDYDEDANSDDSSEMGSEDDDGFDETTLFEIANLLKASSVDVPSTNSFFGPSRDSVDSLVDGYGYSQGSTPQDERSAHETMLVAIQEDADGLQEMPSPMPPQNRPESLWETPEKQERGAHGKGLPQPEDWHVFDEVTPTVRAKPRVSEQPASVASDNLWTVQPLKRETSRSPMWTPPDSPTANSSETAAPVPEPVLSFEQPTPTSSMSEETPESSPLWQAQVQPRVGDHGVGLPHPQDWESYDGIKETIRAKPRQSELVAIESSSLWATEAAPAQPAEMWVPQEQPRMGDHGVGLPHPGDWESYDGVKTTVRAKPRQSELVAIESDDLWAATPPELASPSSLMWAPKARSAPVTSASSPVRAVSNDATPARRSLWSAPAPKQIVDGGLFVANSGRTDYRSTTQAPAAIQMERRSRAPAMSPMDRPTSTTLWAASAALDKMERNWIFSKSEAKAANSTTAPMWSAPASPKERGDSTLFDVNSGRVEFRTTPAPPAAIQMERKSRSPVARPVDRLTSTALWASTGPAKTETNWLSARSSPRTTLMWSAPPSPKESTTTGLYEPNTGRSDFRSTSQAPAAIEINRKSRSPVRQPLEQLTSANLWVKDNSASQRERNWISPSISPRSEGPEIKLSSQDQKDDLQKAIANSIMRITPIPDELWDEALDRAVAASYSKAVPAQAWNDALAEATAASYPVRQTATRSAPMQATPTDWAAALAEAVAESYSTPFDSSKRHPVFAASSLTSNASIVHPAATGYTSDVASVHPVFFGSGAGEKAHPAAASEETLPTVPQPVAAKVPEEAAQPVLARQVSQRGRGGRISAMMSRFENSADSPASSRGPSVERRVATPPRPATPELPPVQNDFVFFEQEQPQQPQQQQDMDPEILAQIEALEQERLFAEQWAAGSFEPVEEVPAVQEQGPLEPSPVFLPATQYTPPTPRATQRQLEAPAAAAAPPPSLGNRADVPPSTPTGQQVFIDEDMFLAPRDVTPAMPLAPLSASSPGDFPQQQQQQQQTPETPKSAGWLSSFTSRFGRSPGKSPVVPSSVPEDQIAPVEQQQQQQQPTTQLARSDTVKSAVSALSETDNDTVALRDSMVSVDSERGKQPAGSKIQFRY